METILKADIFFAVTTFAVIVVTIAAAVALVYLIRILHDLLRITRRVRRASAAISDDLEWARSGVRRYILTAFTFIWRLVKMKNKAASGARKSKTTKGRKRSDAINKT